MKVRSEDYQDMLNYLVGQREEGHEFIAFWDSNIPVDRTELFTFSDQYDVQEFCHEMSTDIDTYSYLAIRSTYRTMAEALKDNALLIVKDGIVDVGLMVSRRYERLEAAQLNNNQNSKVMNEKNFEYLRDQVKFTGFGDALENDLKVKMNQPQPEFMLFHQHDFGKDNVSAVLHFRQMSNSDMYFFNSYVLAVKPEKADDVIKQTFYVSKENTFTLKEAYNLLCGRAVYKELNKLEKTEGEEVQYRPTDKTYHAWVQLDFKDADANGNYKTKYFHDNYGYDIVKELENHPIKELSNTSDKDNLIQSLQKGNRQAVTFIVDGKEQKRFIEAVPKFKSINVYEGNKRIRQSQKEDTGENQTQSRDKKQSAKQKTAEKQDEEGQPAQKKTKRRKQSIS